MISMSVAIQKTTEIRIEKGLLFSNKAVETLRALHCRLVLFCDENVISLWGEKWRAFLEKSGLEAALFPVPSGEREKNRARKEAFEDLLFSKKYGRDSCFIAIGGGVANDLIGFLASTYCRGVHFISVPTTLLAMVDASIGGKTGVDTSFGKNLIGTFYPAEQIFIDPDVLSTLPQREWTNGFAEIIKYALISSPPLFDQLCNCDPKDVSLIEKSVQIKTGVVEEDFEEKKGRRRTLNFGHTIAHALEALEEYIISHGEAVAIGILVESYLSVKLGYLKQAEFEKISSLVLSFPFPLKIGRQITAEGVLKAISMDKKALKNTPRFVLLNGIGSCCPFEGQYCTEVDSFVLQEAIDWMIAQFSGDKQ